MYVKKDLYRFNYDVIPTPTPPSQEGQGLVLNVDNVYERQYASGSSEEIDFELFGESSIAEHQLQIENRDKADRDLIEQVMTEQPIKPVSVTDQVEELLNGQSLFQERRVYSRSEDLGVQNNASVWMWFILVICGVGIGITSSILYRKYRKARTL